jgi:hypothetical protein
MNRDKGCVDSRRATIKIQYWQDLIFAAAQSGSLVHNYHQVYKGQGLEYGLSLPCALLHSLPVLTSTVQLGITYHIDF